jgi:flagellar protein FliO/FliZ
MFESFFGIESQPVKVFVAFIVVLSLILLTAWLVRRFGGERLGGTATRGRQPRLAVIDAAAVDNRRRLVLIRRDNVEHLLLIGGPTDVVVEPNIVRASAAPREVAPSRPAAAATADTLPRAVPLGEGNMWPLQPQAEPAARPQRQQPMVEEPTPWPIEAEPPAQPPQRQSRPVDPLAGLAAELSRMPMQSEPMAPAPRVNREPPRLREPVREQREPVREAREPVREPLREPLHEPAQEALMSTEEHLAASDQNLADMAHRLEAALRRPGKAEPRFAEPVAKTAPAPEPAPPAPPTAPAEAAPAPAARPAKTLRAEPRPAAQKSVYDSLEQEMASLLGRPNNKT